MTQQAQISHENKEIRALSAQINECQALVRESTPDYDSSETSTGEHALLNVDSAEGMLACATHLSAMLFLRSMHKLHCPASFAHGIPCHQLNIT